MDTQHRINISVLNDCYGVLLTSHQTEMISLYYDADVSLGEIAEQYSVSRQAVRDAIMRGERALADYEAKLHIVEKNRRLSDKLHDLEAILNGEAKDRVTDLIAIVEGE